MQSSLKISPVEQVELLKNLYRNNFNFTPANIPREVSSMAIDKKGTKQIADNRKARHDYFVLEQIECGIELVGTEVKKLYKWS